jgi:hypothetical protein
MEREGIVVKIYLEKCFECWWEGRAPLKKACGTYVFARPTQHSPPSFRRKPESSTFSLRVQPRGGYWAPASAGLTAGVAGM